MSNSNQNNKKQRLFLCSRGLVSGYPRGHHSTLLARDRLVALLLKPLLPGAGVAMYRPARQLAEGLEASSETHRYQPCYSACSVL